MQIRLKSFYSQMQTTADYSRGIYHLVMKTIKKPFEAIFGGSDRICARLSPSQYKLTSLDLYIWSNGNG